MLEAEFNQKNLPREYIIANPNKCYEAKKRGSVRKWSKDLMGEVILEWIHEQILTLQKGWTSRRREQHVQKPSDSKATIGQKHLCAN